MKKLLLVDGNSVLFRTYYSTINSNPMSTSGGVPTNAVFGFISLFHKAISLVQPDAVLVAWDAGKPTFRHEKMPDYKGTRKELDEELKVQMPIVREYLDAAGIPRYEEEGYEADDIIGSAAKGNAGMDTVILTSDKDLLQLVDDSTTVYMMKKGLNDFDVYDKAKVWERYGLAPKQIIDLKGLMGDPSDNIPGVFHIGEKTALTLLHKYASVEGVYDHLDEIKGKRHEYLEEGRDSAFLSKEMATIFTEMKLPFDLASLAWNGDADSAEDFYQKYEMQSLLSRMKAASGVQKKLEIITDEQFAGQENASLYLMPVADFAPFKTQTLFGFVYLVDNTIHYLPLEKAKEDAAFRSLLEHDSTLITWDVKEFWHLLDRYGFSLPGFAQDVHLASFLLHSQAINTESLIQASGIILPMPLKDLEKKTKGGFTAERAVPVFGAWLLGMKQQHDGIFRELEEENQMKLYQDIEFPLARVLFEMECRGIDCDASILAQIGEEYEKRMDEIAARIYKYAGHEFKITSPKQLGTVLFDELKLKGGGTKRSTAAEVLEKMRPLHPIVDEVLEYRKYAKIVSTYVDGLTKNIIDGKIFTTFNQTMTQTGRLSSSSPNLQNISIRNEEGKEIRKAFVAPSGHWLISADYSQVELRMLAHMANEEYMIQAFEEGIDIHKRTASVIFDEKPEDVTEDQRRIAKTVNFAIIYGQTEFGLSQELKISRLQAKNFIKAYFANYPNIHRFMDGLIAFCEEHGYVETLLHRRREIPEILDKNFMTREFGKRAAMNAPIQGSAADLIKIAMLHMNEEIQKRNLKSQMLLQIHDELIFLVPDEEKELMEHLIPEVMDHAMELRVPLEASVSTGRSWYEAK